MSRVFSMVMGQTMGITRDIKYQCGVGASDYSATVRGTEQRRRCEQTTSVHTPWA